MTHHLVRYLHHVRREFRRAVDGVPAADRARRVGGINSVAWIAAHLAWQEQSYWLLSRGEPPVASLDAFARGLPQDVPPFAEAFAAWEGVTAATGPWLDALTEEDLRGHLRGRRLYEVENVGSLVMRVIGHYYLHIGQITAVCKLLGEPVPAFVGSQEGAYFG